MGILGGLAALLGTDRDTDSCRGLMRRWSKIVGEQETTKAGDL